jgi:hypothetical protein
MLQDLHPQHCHPPAMYEPAKRKQLDRPSTVDDLADFVVEYINSDVRVAHPFHAWYLQLIGGRIGGYNLADAS